MTISWGYSPKIERYIPLGNFPADRYLIIAIEVINNLGWKLSHISESGLIAYTGLSFQSYSEEIEIRIIHNFAVVKSECIGVQMLFNDYGKNAQNMDKFFHEFEYVEYHLKDVWEESLQQFHQHVATQDDTYFERAPLTAKNKIKNIFYLFWPRKGYVTTPILINLNVLCWVVLLCVLAVMTGRALMSGEQSALPDNIFLYLGANNRSLALEGQLWRLVTSTFLHGSFFHLFFNMYALIYIGLMIENKFGSWNTLLIYLLSGIAASANSVIFHDEFGIMLGASGAIMGMFGALIALILSGAYEKNATRALLVSTLFVISIMLFNGLNNRGVDNAAHIGGLISGFVIGGILNDGVFYRLSLRPIWRKAAVIALTVSVVLGVFYLSPNYQKKEFIVLLDQFKKNATKFSNVYAIERGNPLEAKLNIVRRNGIDIWKANLALVKDMEKLRLDPEYTIYRNYSRKMAVNGYRASKLIYEEYSTGNRHKHDEILRLMQSIYQLQDQMNREAKKEKGGD